METLVAIETPEPPPQSPTPSLGTLPCGFGRMVAHPDGGTGEPRRSGNLRMARVPAGVVSGEARKRG
jgi:hypothetical protein